MGIKHLRQHIKDIASFTNDLLNSIMLNEALVAANAIGVREA
jgi:hypothetical protein